MLTNKSSWWWITNIDSIAPFFVLSWENILYQIESKREIDLQDLSKFSDFDTNVFARDFFADFRKRDLTEQLYVFWFNMYKKLIRSYWPSEN